MHGDDIELRYAIRELAATYATLIGQLPAARGRVRFQDWQRVFDENQFSGSVRADFN
ncbi:MAG: hypothetical protein QGG34_11350 [SAR202 cluster bacterium]|mgnify:CR=1 FL=1|jgi:hypothetical protein|nr:hypothetical protein [SAR202 cluster bacterium]MDP7104341.1 hypothetical protein [SAR202 cluster bacterium]MDP7225872.1 hypothetical protein [SAR202 cluster bacterium]MDP7412218.1 hypothetical protein [SAR202 cluster bacterium]|tara:strand:+ start:2760 stop:2930 length:171 start_codon:yes stop_codon:yes gene_type:complete